MPQGRRLSIAEIATRTGLPDRTIRYIIDHGVVDPKYYRSEASLGLGHGVSRDLSVFAALLVSFAAVLTHIGVRRVHVQELLQAVLSAAGQRSGVASDTKLLEGFTVFVRSKQSGLEIADGRFWRWVPVGAQGSGRTTIPWQPIQRTDQVPADYEPVAVMQVDLSAVYQRLSRE